MRLMLRLLSLLLPLAFAGCAIFEGLAYGVSASVNAVATLPGQDPDAPGHHDFPDIEGVLMAIHERFPERTSLEVIGSTSEGRPLLAMRVAEDASSAGFGEPELLFVGGTHGCEPAATETVLRFLTFLVSTWDELGPIVDGRSVWFVPILNPDGLEYYYRGGPLWWRKNRRPVPGARWRSTGVDLNRNFPVAWGMEGGSSSNPDSVMFRGRGPLSEPESRALHDLIVRRNIAISFSYHTFGNQYLYPYSYEPKDPEPIDFYEAFCQAAAQLNGYTFGNPQSGLLPVHGKLPNGDYDDWMQDDGALPDGSLYKGPSLSMTIEVSPSLGACYFRRPDNNLYFLETVVSNLCAIEIADAPRADLKGLAARMDRIDARVFEILQAKPGGLDWVENMFREGGWIHAAVPRWRSALAQERQRLEELALSLSEDVR